MKKVVLDFHSYAVAESLYDSFRVNSDYRSMTVKTPEETLKKCRSFGADVAVMEVVGNTPVYSYEERMKLREKLATTCPDCKIVLIVDDKVEMEIANKCKEAMRNKEIDLFVFGSASVNHMISLIDVL